MRALETSLKKLSFGTNPVFVPSTVYKWHQFKDDMSFLKMMKKMSVEYFPGLQSAQNQPFLLKKAKNYMRYLAVPHSKSCFDWTVTVGQYVGTNFKNFCVFIFSKFIWEGFCFWTFVLVAKAVAREVSPKLRIFLQTFC